MDTYPPPITKCIRVFRFDPHPLRKQFTVIGETLITVTRNGTLVKEYTQPFKKPVKLVSLNQSSRTDVIVNDILQSCPFIDDNASLRTSLKEAVQELKNRNYDENGLVITSRRASDGSYLPRYLDVFDEVDRPPLSSRPSARSEADEEADILKLNQYVELLYEDIPKKTEGLRLISFLTKSNRYLVAVVEHASASNAIFRTLREDCKRNMNLTNYIFSICLDFAKVRCFHRFLIRHKIPQLIMDILDFELERCEKWKVQLCRLEESARLENRPRTTEEFNTAQENFQTRYQLQNSILRLGFEILHYLSEDRLVATSLLHQGVVTTLSDALDRSEFSLWESVLGHLKDMSAYKEYVAQMINVDILGKLAKILKGKTAIPVKVARVCFSLLSNFSFDPMLKSEIVKMKIISSLSNCLPKSSFADAISKTLYLISMDSMNRSKIGKYGIAETLLGQLTPENDTLEQISRIKGALAVNLAKDAKCAKIMGENIKIAVLVKHAIKNQDILGMKIVRNLVETTSSTIVDQQAGHIAKAVVEVNSLDFVLECVGILAHLDVEQVNFPDLLKRNRLVVWLKRQLMNYMNITNIVEISYQLKTAALEVVMLLSNVCKKEEGAKFIVGEGFVDQMLIRLLHESHTDPQIIQQCVYLFNVCCRHESVSTFLVQKTQFSQELMAFALRIGGKLRSQCDATLHRLSEFDKSWRETMIEHEFLIYNEHWTTAVTEKEKKEANSKGNFPSLMNTKALPCSEYQVFHEIMKGAQNPYNIGVYEDEDERPSTSDNFAADLFDDSTTDEDSLFFSLSQDHSSSSTRINSLEGRSPSQNNNNFYNMYLKQFEVDMASSQAWQFFS